MWFLSVGPWRIELQLHDPQPRVLPLYDGPNLRRRDGSFGDGLDAVGADFDSPPAGGCRRIWYSGPLEIGIAFGFNGWIIMAAEKNSRGGHHWFFTADRTTCHWLSYYIKIAMLARRYDPHHIWAYRLYLFGRYS